MIQRLQSLFLLGAAGIMGAEFATALATSAQEMGGFLSDKVYDVYDHPALMALALGASLFSLIAIFLFRNRGLQVRISYLAITLTILFPAIAILLFAQQTEIMTTDAIEDQAGLYLPIGALIFLILAVRYIKKDEKLVQSMDRLR